MGRRRTKKNNSIWVALVVLLLLLCGGILYSLLDDPLRTIPSLPKEYVADAKSYSGNHYKASGEIDSLLATGSTGERIISFKTDGSIIAVLVPKELVTQNFEKGQHITLLGSIKNDGIFSVKSTTKN